MSQVRRKQADSEQQPCSCCLCGRLSRNSVASASPGEGGGGARSGCTGPLGPADSSGAGVHPEGRLCTCPSGNSLSLFCTVLTVAPSLARTEHLVMQCLQPVSSWRSLCLGIYFDGSYLYKNWPCGVKVTLQTQERCPGMSITHTNSHRVWSGPRWDTFPGIQRTHRHSFSCAWSEDDFLS